MHTVTYEMHEKAKRKTQLQVIMITSMGEIEQSIQEPKMKPKKLRTRIEKPN